MEANGASDGTKDDGYLAAGILIAAVVLVLIVGFYIWRRNKIAASESVGDNSWKLSAFTPPKEREIYISAKEKFVEGNPTQLEELRKLLMKRALKTIPILLSLQNEGSSIERLYKRGMLTDDMHFKVKEIKAFVDQEFQDIQLEADELLDGWGPAIWQQAMQFHQMLMKQEEAKIDEIRAAEDEKKKLEQQKKKEKEKAKKAAVKDSASAADSTAASDTSPTTIPASSSSSKLSGGGSSSSSSSSSSSAVESSNGSAKTAAKAVIEVVDPEQQKILEAERMAQQLIEEEEEERERKRKSASNGKKNSGKKN